MLAVQRQRRMIAWLGWKTIVLQGRASADGTEQRQREVHDRNTMISHLEGRLKEARSRHGQQLQSLRETHEAELQAMRADLEDAHDSLSRLKTFSAHKLREMAGLLERAQQGQAHAHAHAQAQGQAQGMGQEQVHGQEQGQAQALEALLTPPAINQSLSQAGTGTLQGSAGSLREALRLDLSQVRLLSYEKQLAEAAAQVRRLERKLRHAETAKLADESQAAEHAEAVRRVEALEAKLQAQESGMAQARKQALQEASAQVLRAHAQAAASSAIADAPRALEALRIRRQVISLRGRMAVWAIRQWSYARAGVCLHAWQAFTWRCKADRVAAAARAQAAYIPFARTVPEREGLDRMPAAFAKPGNGDGRQGQRVPTQAHDAGRHPSTAVAEASETISRARAARESHPDKAWVEEAREAEARSRALRVGAVKEEAVHMPAHLPIADGHHSITQGGKRPRTHQRSRARSRRTAGSGGSPSRRPSPACATGGAAHGGTVRASTPSTRQSHELSSPHVHAREAAAAPAHDDERRRARLRQLRANISHPPGWSAEPARGHTGVLLGL
uniref:Uncharacterized protein n=1 Tax=Haptolina brevifila TaxID=156173 RepID=A0A7S2BBT8_9EUKA|mmetsp:Transcript_1144/g.2464  ORF Transcript_1144/g.2464 Transcript_1144/m.2464 type:complete len:560 (+) Transcript_1144:121-1800(+)|eukprot:CAMPEP_0174713634 /NCGR_PEP_ID=MMETSP1094-20130205/14230_1 /TAXON_ID=156173 /ORGANISM="Chrysochromulina brevifilum, Strain UTEX LB 985" /LENGTH=559 /DNA_ID=CAMNT_0015912827 /DNA_START=107 /DNA_END=1786 /DNA_ORIENTATION=+